MSIIITIIITTIIIIPIILKIKKRNDVYILLGFKYGLYKSDFNKLRKEWLRNIEEFEKYYIKFNNIENIRILNNLNEHFVNCRKYVQSFDDVRNYVNDLDNKLSIILLYFIYKENEINDLSKNEIILNNIFVSIKTLYYSIDYILDLALIKFSHTIIPNETIKKLNIESVSQFKNNFKDDLIQIRFAKIFVDTQEKVYNELKKNFGINP